MSEIYLQYRVKNASSWIDSTVVAELDLKSLHQIEETLILPTNTIYEYRIVYNWSSGNHEEFGSILEFNLYGLRVKIADQFKVITDVYCNVNGDWVPLFIGWIKENDTWKLLK